MTSLSVLQFTNVPPGRVAAGLAPLRELDPEVVLVVDSRMPTAFDDGYAALADRVVRVEYPGGIGRMYEWAWERCAGDWLLQVDADEVPGSQLSDAVHEAITTPDLTHAMVPRRWLWPDPTRYLAQWPWRPDYHLRLMRRDPAVVRFPARFHHMVEAIGPRRHLRAPLYHADLLLNDREARAAKCRRYEGVRPGLLMEGMPFNEAYYLPELRPELRTREVPEDDLAAVEALLAGDHPLPSPEAPGVEVEHVSAAEATRRWPDRQIPAEAYRARIALLDDDLRIAAGDWRTFDAEVENLGCERWPGGMDAHPQIRVGTRWHDRSGRPADGWRTGFGEPVPPGARRLVAVEVSAPETPGRRRLEIDVVHEDVGWFGCGVTVDVDIVEPGEAPRPRRARGLRGLRR